MDANFYHYRVTATDDAGNESAFSACSLIMTIDTSDPVDAMNLGWSQTSPTNVAAGLVEADWDISTDSGLDDQRIQYYVGASCDTSTGALTPIGTGGDNHFTNTITAPVNGSTYTYTITSVDEAGNSSVSACSDPLVYDTAPPLSLIHI